MNNTISLHTERLLTLSQLSGVGPAALRKVLSLPQHQQLSYEAIADRIPPVAKAISEPSALSRAIESAGKQIDEAARIGARIISVCDPDYPTLLAATKDDPVILYLRGLLAPVPSQSVAIIGTREPTAHGELIANRITEFFVEKGWSIVSGLAIGCDAVAHETAVSAGGHTVAVLAHGLQMIAPARHRKLAERILAAGGALLSEYPFGRDIQKAQYVKRDRTQAGLARGVVMIQSDTVGGSLHASRAALSYGRWLAVPYPTDRDREANEPKTQANLLIAEGPEEARCALLHCTSSALNNVFILKSREQYPRLLEYQDEFAQLPAENTDFLPNTRQHQNELLGTSSESTPTEDLLQQGAMGKDLAVDMVAEEKAEGTARNRAASETDLENWLAKLPLTASDTMRKQPPAAPKLLLVPSTAEAKPSWLALSLDNPGIANALSARLSYVNSRLHVVDATYRKKSGDKGMEDVQLLPLLIDDLLAQMEHAIDFLEAIANVLPRKDIKQNELQNGESASADVNGYADDAKTKAFELLAELSELRAASSHRLILASTTPHYAQTETVVHSEANTAIERADLRLADVCAKFNQIVQHTLYEKNTSLN